MAASFGIMVLLLMNGCAREESGREESAPPAQEEPVEEDSLEPLDNPQEAEEVFEDFQQFTSEVSGFRAEGSTTVQGQTQRAEMAFDVETGSFAGNVEVSGDGLDMELEVIRATGLTWVKGPAAYWESLGYPPHGAEAAEGMYVVFEVSAGDAVADPYNYAQLLEQTAAVGPDGFTAEGATESQGTDFYRYMLGEGEDSPWLELPADGELDSARYISTASSLEADVRFWDFDAEVDVQPPPPDEVLRDEEV